MKIIQPDIRPFDPCKYQANMAELEIEDIAARYHEHSSGQNRYNQALSYHRVLNVRERKIYPNLLNFFGLCHVDHPDVHHPRHSPSPTL